MKFLKLAAVSIFLALTVSSATAQSSLIISGRVDLGLQRLPNNLTSITDTGSSTQVGEGSNARLNFAGREQIDDDLTAFFMIEHRFNADTGVTTDPNVFWKDKSWVGMLSQRYGEVKIGRLHTPQFALGVAGRYEAFFGDSLGSNGTRGARAANQWDDAIYYTTPTSQGLSAGLAVQTQSPTRLLGTAVHLLYAQTAFQIALTAAREQDTLVPAARNAVKTFTVGSWVDIAPVRVMGTFAKSTGVNETETGEEVVYTFGLRLPTGPGEARVSVRRIDDTQRKGLNDASGDLDSWRLGIGYYLPLSKRTSINSSVVRENQTRYNADGTVLTDRTGLGYEMALRHTY